MLITFIENKWNRMYDYRKREELEHNCELSTLFTRVLKTHEKILAYGIFSPCFLKKICRAVEKEKCLNHFVEAHLQINLWFFMHTAK